MDKLLTSYEEFLMKNASLISSVENSLRSLTYVIPGRFQDAALVSEVVYALVSLFRYYNDSVYSERLSGVNSGLLWNQYLQLLEKASPVSGAVVRVYNVMRMGQIPLEMLVQRILGMDRKLLFCFITECLK